MFYRPKAFVFGVGLACSHLLSAQPDTVRQLQEVVVEQSRLHTYRATAYTWQADSAQRTLMAATSVADLLRRTGVGQLRFYGPAGLATASLRGSGSNHTAVLWNGIALASPLNGQLDLSLLPVALFEETTVEQGGAASLYGSGSIGGSIHLNNAARFGAGMHVQAQTAYGSFNTFFQQAGLRWSGKRLNTATQFFQNQATNDFPFVNTAIFPAAKQLRQHNAFRLRGWLHQTYWQLRPRHLIALKWWHQQSNYEVPNPISVARPAEANEKNEVDRLLLSWHFDRPNWNVFVQSAWLHHRLVFTDPVSRINSRSLAQSLIQQAELNQTLRKNVTATGGINYTWEQGRAQEIPALPERHRVAAFYAAQWRVRQWQANGSARLEWVNGVAMPFAPALNIAWSPDPSWQITASAARNYRIPTFNDLYWLGTGAVGNPRLRTENAYAFDVVAKGFLFKSGARYLRVQASVFSNNVRDWILWTPAEFNLWTPDNMKRVWARGIEVQGEWKQSGAKQVSWSWQGQYRYTVATNQEIYESRSPNELFKQLPYTPQHEGSTTLNLSYHGTGLQLVHALTGLQFTDGDNNRFFAIPGYQLTHVWLSHSFQRSATSWRLTAEVNNVFDIQYVARPGFPMPGRYYRLTLQFELKTKKNED
jgi:iron complex outermembrane receptor protein